MKRRNIASSASPLADALARGDVEELRRNPAVIPEALRPRTLVRFGDADDLLISGLLEHGEQLARRAAVVEVPVGKGHVLLIGFKPQWRGQSHAAYKFFFNAFYSE